MRIVVDINHPAHVHYFKNFIWEMQKKGHEFMITASDKDIALTLLDLYHLPYSNLGSYGKGILRKILNIPKLDVKMYNAVKNFRPDIFVSFGSPRAAHAAWFMRKPHIALEDTEHSVLANWLYIPFTDVIMTPECFLKYYGKKQIRFKGTTDLLYLHPNRFTPNPAILKDIRLTPDDTYFIVRFIAWDASHDIGVKGIEDKVAFVKTLERYGRVLITSEGELPAELEKNKITISPEKIHDLMYYATLFIGESGTMASEAACLGTYSILMDPESIQKDGSHTFGVFKYLCGYDLLYVYNNEHDVLNKVNELIKNPDLKADGKKKRDRILKDNIDVTDYLVTFVEDYFKKQESQ